MLLPTPVAAVVAPAAVPAVVATAAAWSCFALAEMPEMHLRSHGEKRKHQSSKEIVSHFYLLKRR